MRSAARLLNSPDLLEALFRQRSNIGREIGGSWRFSDISGFAIHVRRDVFTTSEQAKPHTGLTPLWWSRPRLL
jgi:hypothetical protein